MLTWNAFRIRDGRIPFYPALAEVCEDVDLGLFLGACAACTAASGGMPWVRHNPPRKPGWQELIPWHRKKIASLVHRVFDAPAESEPNAFLKKLKPFISRQGVLYSFGSPEVLRALAAVIHPREAAPDALYPGQLWWSGPIEYWKENIVNSLYGASLVPASVTPTDMYLALECLLDELLQEARAMAHPPEMGWDQWLTSYVWVRYTPVATTGLPFLDYDLAWAKIRRITGLVQLRPSSSKNPTANAVLRSRIKNLLEVTASVTLDYYLRSYAQRCRRINCPVSLQGLLTVNAEDLR